MQASFRRLGIVTGFAAVLVLLLFNVVLARRQIYVQTHNQGEVAHTRETLLSLRRIGSLLADAETGQRGFLYTGDPKYLQPYNQAITRINEELDKLQQLTAGDSEQRAHVNQLRELTRKKIDEMSRAIALLRSGKPDEARSLVLSDEGKLLMDSSQVLLASMEQHEVALETVRLASSRASTRETLWSLLSTTSVAVLGLVLLAFFILRQMEQRERHAEEIRVREEWFRITLTSIGDAVIATDADGRVSFLNPLAEQLTGFTLAEARQQPAEKILRIFNEQSGKPIDNPVFRVVETGQAVELSGHTMLQRRNGDLVPVEDSAAPIRDSQGRLLGVVMVFRDVTRERQTQDLLRKTEKLAAAGRLASTVAHEINNPLAAVLNLVYILKHMPDMPEQALEHLGSAERQLERVSHVTQQTLGFYRESATPVTIEMRPLIESVVDLYRNKLEGKKIGVRIEVEPRLKMVGFPGEMKQLVANLVSNAADAVGFQGKIHITVKRRSAADAAGMELRVEDNGPGIDPQNLGKIFEPFFTTKKDVGTGLGLWVVKTIAERHGGSVRALSRDENGGRGATFSIFLPSVAQPEFWTAEQGA